VGLGAHRHPRHRATVARALDLTEHQLWPNDVPPPADVLSPARQSAPSGGDVIGSWGTHTDPGAPDQVAYITNAVDEVDLLDDGRGLLRTPGLMDALRTRARGGCRVRVLTYTPGRELGPLIGDEGIEPFVFEASPGHALIRVGDQMLVTLSFPGATDQPPPLLQLQRLTDGGLFDRLTDHFQLLADHSGQAHTPSDNHSTPPRSTTTNTTRTQTSPETRPSVRRLTVKAGQ
jgi:hypothetical protein